MITTNNITKAADAFKYLKTTGQKTVNMDINKFKNIKSISYEMHGDNFVKKIVETKNRKVFESVFNKTGKIQNIYAYEKSYPGWNDGMTFLYSKNYNYKKKQTFFEKLVNLFK